MDTLENIGKQFEKQNEILQQMLDIMPRPAGKLERAAATALTVVGILTVVSIIDVIIKWIIGG